MVTIRVILGVLAFLGLIIILCTLWDGICILASTYDKHVEGRQDDH